ncbi:MAG: helix-turn-helix transcriptional regulator [Clostridia bacterium]|nr:helix-turn-helix transcriptional regulator [Clostridia bacterium]
MKFQERFALELKNSLLSQKELAEKLNIDVSNLTKWKQGKNIPSLTIFYQLCKIFDVSADYLLGLTD